MFLNKQNRISCWEVTELGHPVQKSQLWIMNWDFPHRLMELTPPPRKAHHWPVSNHFMSSAVHRQPCREPFIETETSPSSKWIIVDIYATLCLSSHRRIIYKHFFFPAEKGIKLVQEGQYLQAVTMFTEAIKCDPKDNRCIICGLSILTEYLLFRHCAALYSCIVKLRPVDSLGIVPTAITAWSSTLRPWQMLNAPYSWRPTGPKDTFARVVL